jgi:hypothetical protein
MRGKIATEIGRKRVDGGREGGRERELRTLNVLFSNNQQG